VWSKTQLRFVSHLLFIILAITQLTGFVLVSPRVQHLNVTPASPTYTFSWDGQGPTLSDKDTYRDGAFAAMTNEQATLALLEEAAGIWNSVEGSYLKLAVTEVAGPLKIDPEDLVNSIVFSSESNLSVAGYTAPTVSKTPLYDEVTVTDCDIHMTASIKKMSSILSTLTHEMGHCIGLGHPHQSYKSLMSYARAGSSSSKLSADDKAGIIFIYPDPSYDTKFKNLISAECGVISANNQSGPIHASIFFMMPLLAIFGPLLRRGRT